MSAVPPEFSQLAKYYYVAESLSKYNPIVTEVLRHVFADSCADLAPTTASPAAREFAASCQKSLNVFPYDGPEESRLFANDLFATLCASLKSGRVSPALADQFWLCGVVYSILDGDEAVRRERTCRIAAARIRRAFEAARRPPDRAQLRKPATMLRMNRQRAPADVPAPWTAPEDPELARLGVAVSGEAPPLRDAERAAVAERVDLALKMVKIGSRGQALNYLKLAVDLWKK
jgi:hypothetical protein